MHREIEYADWTAIYVPNEFDLIDLNSLINSSIDSAGRIEGYEWKNTNDQELISK